MSVYGITVLISIWIGVIVFFSAIIAPTVFKTLDEKSAGVFLRAFFPKYYLFAIVIGLASLALIMIFNIEMSNILYIAIVSMTILSIISRFMIPIINNARDMGEKGKQKFNRLHALSVSLNVITLVIGLFFIYRV
jgi:hypothetical protein|tara:strand:- start:414 stop:818 length:405 start_codon:yes stop_codon:yes gene_type:complete